MTIWLWGIHSSHNRYITELWLWRAINRPILKLASLFFCNSQRKRLSIFPKESMCLVERSSQQPSKIMGSRKLSRSLLLTALYNLQFSAFTWGESVTIQQQSTCFSHRINNHIVLPFTFAVSCCRLLLCCSLLAEFQAAVKVLPGNRKMHLDATSDWRTSIGA